MEVCPFDPAVAANMQSEFFIHKSLIKNLVN